MPKITLGSSELTYTIKYSKRRHSVQLKVTSAGAVEITAPVRFPQHEVEKLLHLKTAWISAQLDRLSRLAANPVNATLAEGAELLYLGQPHRLALSATTAKRPKVTREQQQLTVHLPAVPATEQVPLLHETLRRWFAKQAAELLAGKTAYWAEQIGVRPGRITIREQKTRWGSCSSRGNINYNWRIIMAPPEVVDYLVIHELYHIKMPNHSADFWLLVAQSSPDFKRHRAWLRQHGSLLARLLQPV